MKRERNQTLELIKLFASYMVVFIHVPLYGVYGETATALARFAVPLFFLISGFYSYNVSAEKIKVRALSLLKLLLFGAVLHETFKAACYLGYGDIQGLTAHFKSYIDPIAWAKFLVFNEPIRGAYLWYMAASIYVYIIYSFAIKLKIKERVITIVSLSLLTVHILFSEVLLLITGISVPQIVVTTFVFMGTPFFGLGLLARKYEEKLFNCPLRIAISALVIGITATLLSRFIIGPNTLYIGTLFVLLGLVTIFVKFRSTKHPKALMSIAGCSTFIYLLHVPVREALKILYAAVGLDLEGSLALQITHPFIVCVMTTLVSFLFVLISEKGKTLKNNKSASSK